MEPPPERLSRARPRATSILIHGINFAPEPIGIGRYTGELARYLVARGLKVEVITAPPHYPGWKLRAPYRRHGYAVEKSDGMIIRRCPLILHQRAFGLWRLLTPLSFALSSAPLVLWRILLTRPDYVLCVEPTAFSAPAAMLGSALVGTKRILHVQDLEVDAAFNVGHLRSNWMKRLAIAFENYVMRHFDLVVTISNRMADKIVEKGVSADRVKVIRNWVDLGKIVYRTGANDFRTLLRIPNDDFVVLYSGQIGPKQALNLLIQAATLCHDNQRIKFIIAGEGPSKQHLIDEARSLPNVFFLPIQPESKLCELLNAADLHVITQDNGAADLVLPSKLAGMLASGRSILVTADPGTELASLLDGVAHVVPPGDALKLADAILRLSKNREPLPRPYDELTRLFSASEVLPAFHDLIRAPMKAQSADL